MTINADSLLSDFGRASDRHQEAARLAIAPAVRDPKKLSGTVPPEPAVIDRTEKPKEVK